MNENTSIGTAPSTEGAHAFPCESCGNRMIYSPADGCLVCSYCKHKKAIESPTVEAPEYLYNAEDDRADAPDWDAEGDATLICPSCGAETVSDAVQMTVTCPFCGNHYVTEPKPGLPIIRPETMIPHKIPKERADELFARWAKRRFFAPRSFRRMRHNPDMTGVYLPYFTFDTDLLTAYSGQGGRRRVITYAVRENGKTRMVTRTVIDWYPVAGNHRLYSDDTPFCASRSIDRRMLQKLGPFSTKTLNVYNPAYLAGFFAERYTVGLAEGFEKIRGTTERRMEEAIEASLGYDTYRLMSYSHRYEKVTFKHILLPVWLSSYRFAGKVYRFMVNGETGRVAGKAPLSPWKLILTILAGVGLMALLFWLFVMLGESMGALLATPAEIPLPELTASVAEPLPPPTL